MTKTEVYKGFTISWQGPPLTTPNWTANVASEHPHLNNLVRRHGAEVIEGRAREEMIGNAKQYIDNLLG